MENEDGLDVLLALRCPPSKEMLSAVCKSIRKQRDIGMRQAAKEIGANKNVLVAIEHERNISFDTYRLFVAWTRKNWDETCEWAFQEVLTLSEKENS
jgi:hypothetical protein